MNLDNLDIDDFKDALRRSWTAETCSPSWREKWRPDNPSAGQCAITALLVNDYLGGEIMRCMTEDGSHYYNLMYGSIVLDFTEEQFGGKTPDYRSGEPRTREYLLSNADTAQRYELLKSNFEKSIKDFSIADDILDEDSTETHNLFTENSNETIEK